MSDNHSSKKPSQYKKPFNFKLQVEMWISKLKLFVSVQLKH